MFLNLFCDHIPFFQANSTHYEAGVVEFSKGTDSLIAYLSIINSQEADGLDIIVFPESTLNSRTTATYVPEPDDKIVPCNNSTFENILSEISCAAKERSENHL